MWHCSHLPLQHESKRACLKAAPAGAHCPSAVHTHKAQLQQEDKKLCVFFLCSPSMAHLCSKDWSGRSGEQFIPAQMGDALLSCRWQLDPGEAPAPCCWRSWWMPCSRGNACAHPGERQAPSARKHLLNWPGLQARNVNAMVIHG